MQPTISRIAPTKGLMLETSLLNSLRGPIYVINSVNTKLPRYTFVLVSFVLLILATILFLCHNREVLWPKKTSTDPHFEKYLGKIPRWRTNLKGMNDDASLSSALKPVKNLYSQPSLKEQG